MTIRLTLWTKGQYFIDDDFEIPDWMPSMDFETNVNLRDRAIKMHHDTFASRYHRVILKHGSEAQVSITIPSDPDHRGGNEKKYILPLKN